MTMERSFINEDMGFACCCWNAPSTDELAALFNSAGVKFSAMLPVHEFTAGRD